MDTCRIEKRTMRHGPRESRSGGARSIRFRYSSSSSLGDVKKIPLQCGSLRNVGMTTASGDRSASWKRPPRSGSTREIERPEAGVELVADAELVRLHSGQGAARDRHRRRIAGYRGL